MATTKIDEKRLFVRAKRVLSIQYRIVNSKRKITDKGWHLSTTQDMSAGGLAFYTDQAYQKNDVLEVHVVMSGILDIFNGYAKVLRVKEQKKGAYYLTAVKFVDRIKSSRSAKTYQTTKKKVSSRTKHL